MNEVIMDFVKESVVQLKALKESLEEKKAMLEKRHEALENRVQELAKNSKQIKIDPKQKKQFDTNCAHYSVALETLIQDIGKKIASFEKPDESENLEKLSLDTKQFIKRIAKEVAISDSRFSFSFDKQEQQLGYLEANIKKAIA